MQIKKVALDSLKTGDTYTLSFPVRPEIYPVFSEKFPGFPPIIIDQDLVIVFGIDAYHFFKTHEIKKCDVFEIRISLKDGLFLNYNLKENLFGLNRFEKLLFLKKVLPLSDPDEIHHRTQLDITVDRELTDKLEALLADEFKAVWINDRINPRTAFKILKWPAPDRIDILQLFEKISFSASHQLGLLDMLEEIRFRDKISTADIFKQAGISRLADNDKPQKEIIKAVFTLRFPLYSQAEEEWETWINKLELPGNIQIRHGDFFEKKQLNLTMQFNDPKEVENALHKLKK